MYKISFPVCESSLIEFDLLEKIHYQFNGLVACALWMYQSYIHHFQDSIATGSIVLVYKNGDVLARVTQIYDQDKYKITSTLSFRKPYI